jgi:hypothetical protein
LEGQRQKGLRNSCEQQQQKGRPNGPEQQRRKGRLNRPEQLRNKDRLDGPEQQRDKGLLNSLEQQHQKGLLNSLEQQRAKGRGGLDNNCSLSVVGVRGRRSCHVISKGPGPTRWTRFSFLVPLASKNRVAHQKKMSVNQFFVDYSKCDWHFVNKLSTPIFMFFFHLPRQVASRGKNTLIRNAWKTECVANHTARGTANKKVSPQMHNGLLKILQ